LKCEATQIAPCEGEKKNQRGTKEKKKNQHEEEKESERATWHLCKSPRLIFHDSGLFNQRVE
jgi:hypothetical protein